MLFGAQYAYIRGLLALLFLSGIGLWLIFRASNRHTAFLDGLVRMRPWVLILIGLALQGLAIWYVCLGVRAGLF